MVEFAAAFLILPITRAFAQIDSWEDAVKKSTRNLLLGHGPSSAKMSGVTIFNTNRSI